MAVQAQFYPEKLVRGGGFITQDRVMESNNSCGGFNEFAFNVQQKQQQSILRNQNQNLLFPAFKGNANTIMDFSSHALEQSSELDRFIAVQDERLRLMLLEQRKQLVVTLMAKFESKALPLLRQKDEEICQAAKRSVELENLSRKLEIEKNAWHRTAIENSAMVQSLKMELQELSKQAKSEVDTELDAESCCEVNRYEGTGESRGNSMDGKSLRNIICRSCNSESSCVMFLPCRHLSSCKDCETLLHCCPACGTPKKAFVEIANL